MIVKGVFEINPCCSVCPKCRTLECPVFVMFTAAKEFIIEKRLVTEFEEYLKRRFK